MIDANKGLSEEFQIEIQNLAYERVRAEIVTAVTKLMREFEMGWEDLARLAFPAGDPSLRGECIRETLHCGTITIEFLNRIAAAFSAEPYIIFRPRFPWTQS
jgi:hypothetical protein